jgi:carbon monoxide dehydrogenase subunit G
MRRPLFSRSRSALLAAALTGALVLHGSGAARAGSHASYTYHRDAKDPRWVQGEVTVDAPPDVVFATLEKVDAWPQTLTDIARLKVLSHRGDHWEVELETRTIPAGMLGYDVAVSPAQRSLKLYTNRLGVYTIAQTDVRPGASAGQSVVTYSLLIQVSGLPSLLISEKSLRQKQEHMVDVTLADLERAFTAKRPAN